MRFGRAGVCGPECLPVSFYSNHLDRVADNQHDGCATPNRKQKEENPGIQAFTT